MDFKELEAVEVWLPQLGHQHRSGVPSMSTGLDNLALPSLSLVHHFPELLFFM
jgi:hypothetical protein